MTVASRDYTTDSVSPRLKLLDVLESKQGGNGANSASLQQGFQQSPYQVNSLSLPALEQGQPPLVPQGQASHQAGSANRPHMHSRQQSFGSTPQQNALALQHMQQQPPFQHPSDPASNGSQSFQTPNFQTPQTQDTTPKAPGSPQRTGPPVWSGPIKWTFVDPQQKAKRDLAFYVDAVPIRPNATAELWVQLGNQRLKANCRSTQNKCPMAADYGSLVNLSNADERAAAVCTRQPDTSRAFRQSAKRGRNWYDNAAE